MVDIVARRPFSPPKLSINQSTALTIFANASVRSIKKSSLIISVNTDSKEALKRFPAASQDSA
nr:MAG TPA: hypothetical protein [Caudoviricetes sp.]